MNLQTNPKLEIPNNTGNIALDEENSTRVDVYTVERALGFNHDNVTVQISGSRIKSLNIEKFFRKTKEWKRRFFPEETLEEVQGRFLENLKGIKPIRSEVCSSCCISSYQLEDKERVYSAFKGL